MKDIETRFPVDALVYTPHGLAAGSYHYCEGERLGDVAFYNEDEETLDTKGTFDIDYRDGILAAANTESVTFYNIDTKETTTHCTAYMNTYITHGDEMNTGVFIASTFAGNVDLYNDMRLSDTIRVSEDTVWVSEMYGSLLVSGCEDGKLVFTDYNAKSNISTMRRESGVTSLYRMGDLLLVGSYDENIEVVDIRKYEVVKRVRVGGGIWRIEQMNDKLYASCMYEGVKVLDKDFETVKVIPTGSIAYGLAVNQDEVAFSSFYDRKIHIRRHDNLFEDLS